MSSHPSAEKYTRHEDHQSFHLTARHGWGLLGLVALVAASFAFYLTVLAPRMGQGSHPSDYGRTAIDHIQRLGIDSRTPEFARAKTEALRALEHIDSYEEARDVVAPLLAVAGGGEFFSPEKVSAAPAPSAQQQSSVTRKGSLTTVTLPTLGGGDSLDLRRYGQNVTDVIAHDKGKTCGWVIDLRGSRGVDLPFLLQPLSSFLQQGTVLTIERNTGRDEIRVTGGEIEQGNAVRASGPQLRSVDSPVVVLIDSGTDHDAALAARALSASPNIRFYGEPSSADTRLWNEAKMPDSWVLRVAAGRFHGVADKGAVTSSTLPVGGSVVQGMAWLEGQCRK